MERRKEFGPGDPPTEASSSSRSEATEGLTHFRSALNGVEQRVRMLMNESIRSAQQSGAVDDVVLFRVTQDRRRSPVNILPYRQRRATDQRH
jgi:hypothetical protein